MTAAPAPDPATTGPLRVLPLQASSYQRHTLHGPDRVWPETNCALDALVEVLHALGAEPLAVTSVCLAADFWEDQWALVKIAEEDLEEVFGVQLHELTRWRPRLLDHVAQMMAAGHLVTLEADAWHLPDTAGVGYHETHAKTMVVPNLLDPAGRRLGYFHNAGYFELSGEDYDAALGLGAYAVPPGSEPYAEVLRLHRLRLPEGEELTAAALRVLRRHLARRPEGNPVRRLVARVEADLPLLRERPELFSDYAFANLRTCGSTAEVAATGCSWLAGRLDGPGADALRAAADELGPVAEAARVAQLKLARVARGRSTDVSASWEAMAGGWERAQRALDALAAPAGPADDPAR